MLLSLIEKPLMNFKFSWGSLFFTLPQGERAAGRENKRKEVGKVGKAEELEP